MLLFYPPFFPFQIFHLCLILAAACLSTARPGVCAF